MIYVQFKLAELISLPYFCIMWHIYLHCALCICLYLMLKLDKWNWTIFCNKACRQVTWGANCETIETQISSAQWIQDMMSLVGFCLQLKNILMWLVVISYACYLLRIQLGLCTLFSILASELPISIQKKKKELAEILHICVAIWKLNWQLVHFYPTLNQSYDCWTSFSNKIDTLPDQCRANIGKCWVEEGIYRVEEGIYPTVCAWCVRDFARLK